MEKHAVVIFRVEVTN